MNNTKEKGSKLVLSLVIVMFLAFSVFYAANVLAAPGEGTATIGGGASQTVEVSSTTTFTVVLIVGASGIADDAASPTFTIPAGFTAPEVAGEALIGDVDVAGEWFAAGTGSCVITIGLSSAAGQTITVDVTTSAASGDTIVLTYRGTAPAAASPATALAIATDDVSGGSGAISIEIPPSIVVKGTAVYTNHAVAGVASTNNLEGKAGIGGTDLLLGGFKITATGENIAFTKIRTIVTLDGMAIGELTSLRIVPDDGTGGGVANDGTMHAGELAAPLATIASPISGNNDFMVSSTVTAGSHNYFIVGTIASTVSDGDTLDIEAIGAGSVSSGITSLVAITPTGTSSNDQRTITDTTKPTLSSAKFTSLTTLEITFSEDIGLAATVDETKITLTDNSGTAIAVTDNSAVVLGNKVTVTVANVGSTSFSITTGGQGLDLATDAVQDLAAVNNKNLQTLNNAVADGIAPTIASIALTNPTTITVTFSEQVKTPATSTTDNWVISAGATTPTITGVQDISGGSTTHTLTISGYTGGQVQLLYTTEGSQDIVDTSAAGNALVTTVATDVVDSITPTFTAVRTALNTIVLTFSETVNEPANELTAWTVTGATGISATTSVVAGTSMTITTTGLTATDGTPAVTYVAANGDAKDTSTAPNEVANGVTANAADQVKPTFMKAWEYDTDSNGNLDEIVIEMSESISDANVHKNNFSLSSGTINSIGVDGPGTANPKDPDVTNDKYFTLEVAVTGTTNVTVSYNVGTLADLASNTALTNAAITIADVTPPQLVYAVFDADHNGKQYTYVDLCFSEAVRNSTIATTDFLIADPSATVTMCYNNGNTSLITLKLDSKLAGDSPRLRVVDDINDMAGNTLSSAGPVTINTYRINLNTGWNMFSIPANVSGVTIHTLLTSVWANIDKTKNILWYHALTSTWKYYSTRTETGTFTSIEPGKAYWIRMNTSDTLIGNYSTYPSGFGYFPTVVLEGNTWNMIGTWTTYNQTASTAGGLASLSDVLGGGDTLYKYTSIGTFANIYGSTTIKMRPGDGFWFFIVSLSDGHYTIQEP